MRVTPSSRRPPSLAGQLFAMQVVLVATVVAGCVVFAYVTDRDQARDAARHRAGAVARAVAASPSVREAVRGPDPTRRLQPYAEQVRRDTGVTFVTIMDTDGTRWTHPDPARIGGRFVGHTGRALEGRTFTETYTGTLGPSVRAVAPVRARAAGGGGGAGAAGGSGAVVGLVSAGIAVDDIGAQLRRQVVSLLAVGGGALLLGGLGTYVVNARLRRHTHGMNAGELGRLHDYHQATLHAVREGLLTLDGRRRVALLNDGARELLGLPAERTVVGRRVDELDLPPSLTAALLDAAPRVDEVHLTADRVVVLNTSPVRGGEHSGTVVTLRDHTEIQSLAGELDSVRGLAEALRSQAHEAANRLHTVVSLIELGRAEEAVDFATEELELAQALTDQVVSAVGEPVLAALLLGKAAHAHERGAELVLSPDSHLDDDLLPPGLPVRDLVTVLGNLIDNALDATTSGAGTEARDGTSTGAGTRAAAGTGGPAGSGAGTGAGEAAGTGGAAGTQDTVGSGEAAGAGDSTGAGATGGKAGAGGASTGGAERTGAVPAPAGARPADIPAAGTAPVGGPPPRVTVTVRGARPGPGRPSGPSELLLRVADSGPGVPPDAVESVFLRGWSTKAGPEGRGLGLALVRQTAHRHGGSATVSRSACGGAEFTVRLPLPARAPDNREPDGPAPDGRGEAEPARPPRRAAPSGPAVRP